MRMVGKGKGYRTVKCAAAHVALRDINSLGKGLGKDNTGALTNEK